MPEASIFRFADIEVRPDERLLLRAGVPVAIEPKAFRVLVHLLCNPGRLITKDELLNGVWEDVAVSENSLTRSVASLRRQLGDDAREPRFIATVHTAGYRFICPLEVSVVEAGAHGDSSARSIDASGHRNLVARVSLAAGIGIALLVLAWLFRPTYPKPRIIGEVQLTSDGTPKWGPLATDGQRVYFTEIVNGHQTIATVPVSGGQPVPLRTPFANSGLYGISRDRNDLLLAESANMFQEAPLWRFPIFGGTPRRLGNVVGHDASWSPDGAKLAYVIGSGVYVANADGSDARRLVPPTGVPNEWAWRPTWSPDGRRLRFDYYEMDTHKARIWEVNVDGNDLHPVFAASADWTMQSFGSWTPDGTYYVFTSWKEIESAIPWPAANLWAVREKSDVFHRGSMQPENLTTGPIRYFANTLSSDGKAIFALSSLKHGELMRYDLQTKNLSLFRSGPSVEGVSFSRDGAWLAYVKYPQGELWRSRTDGGEPLQLSWRPLFASTPVWSPDGKQIAFVGMKPGELSHIYIASADGGRAWQIAEIGSAVDPNWSPDGNSLTFVDDGDLNSMIKVLNLRTRTVTPIAGSRGLKSPRLSPDGSRIAALSNNFDELSIFDQRNSRWKEIARASSIGWHQWSHDGKYVYFAPIESHLEIFRIGVNGGRPEQVVSLKDLRTTGFGPGWFSLTPEDDVLLLHDTGGGTEIYQLSWGAP